MFKLRPANPADFEFAFEVKRQALGPHIAARWGWDAELQRQYHAAHWQSRPWSIITVGDRDAGTVSIHEGTEHIQFGEFYLLPEFQRQGIGSAVLKAVIERADKIGKPVKLEHLKWNPVGSLYQRNGFRVVGENDTHYFLTRQPMPPQRQDP